jgi:mevalonate kinase
VFAAQIDEAMRDSVLAAYNALQMDEAEGLTCLADAINKAHICFTQWGLAGGRVEQHINQLLSAGALAAKPTGSGDGGFVLSLWPQKPAVQLPFELIALS